MPHLGLWRGLVGGAVLAGCIALLAGQARADIVEFVPQPPIAAGARTAPVAPSLFGTVALPTTAPRYVAGWRRAGLDASAQPSMQRLIAPARELSRERQIAYVQAEVNRNILLVPDSIAWGVDDYWASAAETLQRGAGDVEDRAIVKMQALRSLGFPARELYLTMGRDTFGRPTTMLLVRLGRRFYVLDDLGGRPVPAGLRQGFEPTLTLGLNAAWIHGHRLAASDRTAVATSAAR